MPRLLYTRSTTSSPQSHKHGRVRDRDDRQRRDEPAGSHSNSFDQRDLSAGQQRQDVKRRHEHREEDEHANEKLAGDLLNRRLQRCVDVPLDLRRGSTGRRVEHAGRCVCLAEGFRRPVGIIDEDRAVDLRGKEYPDRGPESDSGERKPPE